MSLIEWLATGCGIIYILLAIRNLSLCFVFGLVGSLIWAYASYEYYQLIWDASLNVFYAAMSIYGLWAWQRGQQAAPLAISEWPISKHLSVCAVGLVFVAGMTYVGQHFLAGRFAFWDAFTTVYLVIGTIMLTRRVHSSWIYLLIADIIYIFIYQASGATLFMWMMVLYSVMAVVGYIQWRKLAKLESRELSH